MTEPRIELLDDIVIPRSEEIVIPQIRSRGENEEEFFLVCKGRSPDDTDDRVRRFMGTLETQDRKGDEVALAGWDFTNFKRNPIVLWNHRLTGEMTDILGRVTRIKREKIQRKSGDALEGWAFDVWFLPGSDVNPGYHDNGEMAKALVDAGVLNACSVTFRPITSKWLDRGDEIAERSEKGERRHDDPGVRWLKKEMLEFTLCMVGAHQDALQLAQAKGLAVPEFMSRDFQTISKPGWDDADNENATEIKFRVREPGQFQEGSFRRVTVKKDKPRVVAVMGRLKGQSTMSVQALRFPKGDGWTLDKAKAWLKEHKDLTKAWEQDEEDEVVIPAPRDKTPAGVSRTQDVTAAGRDAWLDTVAAEARRNTSARALSREEQDEASLLDELCAESAERRDAAAVAPSSAAHRPSETAEMGGARLQRGHAKRRMVRVVKRAPARKRVFKLIRRRIAE